MPSLIFFLFFCCCCASKLQGCRKISMNAVHVVVLSYHTYYFVQSQHTTMTISNLAILSRTERGTDDLLFIKQFKSNTQPIENDHSDDIDAILFQNILTVNETNNNAQNTAGSSIFTVPQSTYHANNTIHNCSIRHQSLLQAALEKLNNDIQFENHQRVTFRQSSRGAEYMWVGFICLIDEFRFYAYITNTNVKIIAGVEDNLLPEQKEMQIMRDNEVKKTLVS